MLDSPDAPNHPAAPDDAQRAELGRRDAAIAERDRLIAELTAQLEEARLTLLWQRTEIAARDQRIADFWELADGLNRAVAALSAERDAWQAARAEGPSPAGAAPQGSWLGRMARRRDDAHDPAPTAEGRSRRVS